ncbi:TNT domain-containing protein [Streptomyces sasae]|uniref:TNT domain-containing protein n=1 Tax=Streptomyces sasae TaxID=1266772 RepID=UPI00292E18A8|nr:TNT domain-containing protein [Streptomyces sasae]
MRALRRLLWSALASSLVLIGAAPAPAQADEPHPQNGSKHNCPIEHRTASTTKAPPTGLQDYYHGDWRLGPSYLGTTGVIGRMLRGYRPQDSTSQFWFLGCYWQTDQQNQSGWWYPDNNGFVLRDGRPVEAPKTLRVGQRVDLFGSGNGFFLAPEGTPYTKRALPPTNLDEYDPKNPPFNYHLYRVVKPLTVQAGPIRPWFGQEGLGEQFLTRTRVSVLAAPGGYLKEIAPPMQHQQQHQHQSQQHQHQSQQHQSQQHQSQQQSGHQPQQQHQQHQQQHQPQQQHQSEHQQSQHQPQQSEHQPQHQQSEHQPQHQSQNQSDHQWDHQK